MDKNKYMKVKSLIIAATLIAVSFASKAQILNPVKWSYAAKKINKTEAVVYIKATIDEGWHLYSQHVKDGGPIKTSFSFTPSKEYTLNGKTTEPKPITQYEKVFSMEVSYFANSVVFQQKVKLNGASATVKGTIEYMVCDDKQCLPPEEVKFSIPVK